MLSGDDQQEGQEVLKGSGVLFREVVMQGASVRGTAFSNEVELGARRGTARMRVEVILSDPGYLRWVLKMVRCEMSRVELSGYIQLRVTLGSG